MSKRFDFGENWKSYSQKALDEDRFLDAENSLKSLFETERFDGLSFLDLGCGSGIFSIAAKRLGAGKIVGIDISPNSIEASRANCDRLGLKNAGISFELGDVLDPKTFSHHGSFDRVYAWGSLHHTGDLWKALENALGSVKPGGKIVVAVYHRHWTSASWKVLKKIYVNSPRWIQKILIGIFFAALYVAKLLITRKNPMEMKRGMDFYHDVVDWIGGYPYEYASPEEISEFMKKRNFSLKKLIRTDLLTGNNQFLFVKE